MLQAALLALMLQDKPDPEAEAVFKTVRPSVVRIVTYQPEGSSRRGCGVVVNGGILTSADVGDFALAVVVLVSVEGRIKRFDAKVAAFDEDRDLALLTLPADAPKLPQVPLCSGDVEKGRKIFVVGWPWEGPDTTVTAGTVTSKGPDGKVETLSLDTKGDDRTPGATVFNSAGQVVGIGRRYSTDKAELAVAVSAVAAFLGEKDKFPPPARKTVPEKDVVKKAAEWMKCFEAFVELDNYRYWTNGLVNQHVDLLEKEKYSYESVAKFAKPAYTELYDEIRNHKIPAGVPEPGLYRALREQTYKRLENFWELLGNKRAWSEFEKRDKSCERKIVELEVKILNRLFEGP